MIRIFHRTRKLLACENKTLLQWKIEMDLLAQGRSQRKKRTKRMLDRPITTD